MTPLGIALLVFGVIAVAALITGIVFAVRASNASNSVGNQEENVENQEKNVEGKCIPNCKGKCGAADDGCGGRCLGCPSGQECVGTTCGVRPSCVPKCEGKCGGPDGCNKGGTCPNSCPEGQICKSNQCVKKPGDPSVCKSDADCAEFPNTPLCDIWTNGGCVSTKCESNKDCPDPSKKFCDTINKTCIASKALALLGPEGKWVGAIGGRWDGQYIPTCSSDSVKRSNSGWCKESDSSKCPEGWELRTVKGNPDGNGKGGNQVTSTVCVPTKKAPPNWTFDSSLNMFVPPCKTKKEFREEGYCVWDKPDDCVDGYSKFTNQDGMGFRHYIDYCGPSVKD